MFRPAATLLLLAAGVAPVVAQEYDEPSQPLRKPFVAAASNVNTQPTTAEPAAKPSPVAVAESASPTAPTSIYLVGDGDVLDIRILNQDVQTASTLYTVQSGGLLEYPLVGEPLAVSGTTTDDIDRRLTAELKRRAVFDEPQVVVSVREYVSHAATVTGLVERPGAKTLRREALPLYVLLAEAEPRPEAGQIVITSPATNSTRTLDLADAGGIEILVRPGDAVRVVPRPPQFFYVGGEAGSPGQKDFHPGMTLTQAVLAAGGKTRRASGRVRVARQAQDGRLVATEYDLRQIEQGRIPDPALQAGDRLELYRR